MLSLFLKNLWILREGDLVVYGRSFVGEFLKTISAFSYN